MELEYSPVYYYRRPFYQFREACRYAAKDDQVEGSSNWSESSIIARLAINGREDR